MSAPTRGVAPRPALTEWLFVFAGLAALLIPTWYTLAYTLWSNDDQSQGPIILSVALWYFWKNRAAIHAMPPQPSLAGWPLLVLGLLLYMVGRSQDILIFEVGSHIVIIAAVLLIMRGTAALKLQWFPLLFMVFMLPLPGPVVDALTLPMKISVSWATEHILYWADYPISRTGVMLQIGQYKLLVADACAGLHTLFTLECLGLLYLHIVRHESWTRNTLLTLLIIPISYSANTIRVIVLTLITYHFGDEAGQGFLHGFAGMVLFMSALVLIIGVDSLLQYLVRVRTQKATGST